MDTATTEIYTSRHTLSLHVALPIFPQPLGPKTPVSPGSIRNSVGSTKLLKPVRRSRFICTGWSRADHRIGAGATLVSHIPHAAVMPRDRKRPRLNSSH